MTNSLTPLPSWREGSTRQALLSFLDASSALPIEQRVAAFDNDGTLWCERPTYAQLDFFVSELANLAAGDPSLRDRPEFEAVLSGDSAAIGELGVPRVAMALAGLFAGVEPQEFTSKVRAFMAVARHRTLDIPLRGAIYQPMLELLDELRRRQFTVFIVSGGGVEFVRAISQDLYGVAPEAVVGTQVTYEFSRDDAGQPTLRRTGQLDGDPNEGAVKVHRIQAQLGRRPVFAAGNSAGDREMMEWACAGDGPHLALLVDHDDAEREFQYVSLGATVSESEPITEVASRLGWVTASMAKDWHTVFAARR